MKQVFFDGKGKLYLKDVPSPAMQPGHVLVQNSSSLISTGTEAMALSGGGSLLGTALKRPDLVQRALKIVASQGVRSAATIVRDMSQTWYPLGYSSAGHVISVGEGVRGFDVGDKVACAGAGYANHAELVSIPTNLLAKVPQGVSMRDACFTTVGAIAIQGVRRADLTFGEIVVVMGTGLIGLLTAQILRSSGCKVICVDLYEERLRFANELGFVNVLQMSKDNVVRSVMDLTDGAGADAVIVCASTESSQPVNDAFEMCRERGRVVVVGAVGLDLKREEYYRKEIDLRISRSYGPGRYDTEYEEKGIKYPLGYVRWTETGNLSEFLHLLESGAVRVQSLISSEHSVDQASVAYDEATGGNPEIIGVLLRYPDTYVNNEDSRVWRLPDRKKPFKQQVKLILVGPGHFARAVHFNNLKKLSSKVFVKGVVAATGSSARQSAEKLGADLASTDMSSLLKTESIDAVMITTRHNMHSKQCVEAVLAGKHVFVEKPLGLNKDECYAVLEAVEKSQVLCSVGFNRRFSSYAIDLRSSIANINSPKQIVYRVNAGGLPDSHWLLDSEIGGGRLVGEGCHFFDFMSWILDAEPVTLVAQSLSNSLDDFSILLKYADGSVGSLIYTGLGNDQLSKEYIELFAGGGVGVIDDYRSLQLYNLPGNSRKSTVAHKGHLELLDNFLCAVKGEQKLGVNALDGLRATLCAEAALESISTGKVVQIPSV